MTLTFIIFGLKWYYLCVAGGIIVWAFKIWPSGKIEDLGDNEYSTMSEARVKTWKKVRNEYPDKDAVLDDFEHVDGSKGFSVSFKKGINDIFFVGADKKNLKDE